jgi:hypothetical protein
MLLVAAMVQRQMPQVGELVHIMAVCAIGMILFTKNIENIKIMSQNLYQTIPLVERSALQKLFGQYPHENALIELNNLFAKKSIKEINSIHLQEIENRYNVNLNKEYQLNLEEFYAVYLNHCLIDKSLSDDEIDTLNHLKLILSLNDKSINNINAKLGTIIYKSSFQEVVSDGKISKKEEAFLNKLESDLNLPKQLVDKISEETRKTAIQNYIIEITSDRRISPEEESELKKLAKNLDVQINADATSTLQFKKLKQYWALENLDLISIETEIALQKSEICYLEIPFVNWYEHRARQTYHYGAYVVEKNTMNFYLDSNSKPCNLNQLSLIEKGSLYITNKRVIFLGQEKNSNIKFGKILNIKPYKDGIEIIKETGKNPVIQVRDNADILCLILQRLMKEQGYFK